MSKKYGILVIGCGEHARTVIDNIEEQAKYEVIGLVTNIESELGNSIHGYKVVCCEKDLHEYVNQNTEVVGYFLGVGVSSGNMRLRQKIYSKLDQFLEPVNIIHPTAILSRTAVIGKGNLFEAYTKVANDVIVGNHNIVYSFTAINHDQVIGDNILIGCNVSMAGKSVGNDTIISDGSSIGFKKHIGKSCILGDGTVVTKDVPDHSILVGNPGKIIGKNE